MQEVFEKIIEKLKETDFNDIQMVGREVLLKYGFPYESTVQDEIWDCLDELSSNKFAINIVKKIEKEYNNGWISVSERLPADEEIVLMVVKQENGKTRIILQVFYPVLLDTPGIEIKYWQPMPKLPLEYQPKGE